MLSNKIKKELQVMANRLRQTSSEEYMKFRNMKYDDNPDLHDSQEDLVEELDEVVEILDMISEVIKW